jgi:polysaccharide export outer membrane protein
MRLKRLIIVGVFATAWGCLAFSAEPPISAAAPNAAAPAPPMAAGPGAQVPAGTAGSAAAAPAEVAGAAPSPAAAPGPAAAGSTIAASGPAVSKDYVLQPGDELQIAVWKETDLTLDVFIRPDGGISFPLAGDLPAAGHSVAELTTLLEKRVRRYEPDAVVTVMVKAAIGNRVYVIGKVNKPGDFALNRPIDVMQALSLAGGATPFANTNHIRVLRREGTAVRAIAFRYGDVQRGRKLDQNILLKSGDTVVVP